MPVAGRKPKPDGQIRHRVKPTYEWTDVPDVPFEGQELTGRWSKAVREWWADLSTMPHCALWKQTDWRFAIETARVAAEFYRGDMKLAKELRDREKQMGFTHDDRRAIRIRYQPPETEGEESAGVTSLDDYRAALSE